MLCKLLILFLQILQMFECSCRTILASKRTILSAIIVRCAQLPAYSRRPVCIIGYTLISLGPNQRLQRCPSLGSNYLALLPVCELMPQTCDKGQEVREVDLIFNIYIFVCPLRQFARGCTSCLAQTHDLTDCLPVVSFQ